MTITTAYTKNLTVPGLFGGGGGFGGGGLGGGGGGVEPFGLGEGVGVAVRACQGEGDECAGREAHVAVFDVLGRDAQGSLHSAEVPHRFFDNAGREFWLVDEGAPLVGMSAEERDATGELIAGGVGTCHQDGFGEHDQLVG